MSPMQSVVFNKLKAANGEIVSHADLQAEIDKVKFGPKGRPLKVVLHYLRKRIEPDGYAIVNHRDLGFSLASPPAS